MVTRYQVNADRSSAFAGMSGKVLLLVVDYRGFTHPVAGAQMRPTIAAEVENYIQGLIIRRGVRESRALKLSASRYLLADPFASTARASTRFVAFCRGLTKNLLTPASSGFSSGVPFWGSCSAVTCSASELRAAMTRTTSNDLSELLQRSRRPDFQSAFYNSPKTTILVDESGSTDQIQPRVKSRPVALGSYPSSSRLYVDSSQSIDNELQLFSEPHHAVEVVGLTGRSTVIDFWDPWCEVVPIPESWQSPVDQEGIAVDVLRQLEPLISQLWRQYGAMADLPGELDARLHQGLVDISEAVRSNQSGGLRASLLIIVSVVGNIATNVVASYIWEQWGDTLRRLLERL